MPKLKLIKGDGSWREHRIDTDSVWIGRDSRRCRAVLSEDSVSRRHAEIVAEGDKYFLVDHNSKSGTKLNGALLDARKPYLLQDHDLIQICDYALTFLDDVPRNGTCGEKGHGEEDSSGYSSILDSSSNSWALRTAINPEAKLTAIMELTGNLRHSASLEELLWNALGGLLQLFRQAHRGVVVLTDAAHQPSVNCVVRKRTDDDEALGNRDHASRTAEVSTAGLLRKRFSAVSEDETVMCAPMVDAHDEPLGAITLELLPQTGRFTGEDLDLLATVAVELSFAVENWILREAALREQQLQLELQVANEVQIGLLPAAPPEIEGYGFFDYYAPARQVGGDYFDYLKLDDQKLAVVLGDVSGKGVPAALLMAKISGEMGVHLATGLDPKDVLERVNPLFKSRSTGGRFVTLVLAVIDLKTNKIALVNAGHMPPLLRRVDTEVEEIGCERSGMPLGIYPVQHYEESHFVLGKGEALVFYSDGVTDATSAAGQPYGLERLRSQLAVSSNAASDIGARIVSDLHRFVGTQQQTDDISLLCVNRNP